MDYKKYSLENLENWLHDAMSSGEATPQEIYDLIVGVVKENYYIYKQKVSQADELLALLNGNGQSYEDVIKEREYYEPSIKKSWTNFQEDATYPLYVSEDGDMWIPDYVVKKEDKVVKWQLPVKVDGLSGDCFVEFPDDLLEAANLKEGDTVNWIDRGDGSFELRKVTKPLGMDEC
jgi:hypothetical protein